MRMQRYAIRQTITKDGNSTFDVVDLHVRILGEPDVVARGLSNFLVAQIEGYKYEGSRFKESKYFNLDGTPLKDE